MNTINVSNTVHKGLHWVANSLPYATDKFTSSIKEMLFKEAIANVLSNN